MIIGITGNYASGKDAVAEMLQNMNFNHISLSDMIRIELNKKRRKVTRDNLIEMGNELRTKHGANILASMALERIEDGENYALTSIRNPEEVNLLKKRKDFILVHITTPDKIRIKRILERNRENDPKTLKELIKKEKLENSDNPNAQQLMRVAGMAKIVLTNDTSLEALEEKIKKVVADWIYKLQETRPNWDKYFMGIAEAVKMRCSCMSAKKGALIVKEKQIISTGYNGTPKKIKHCTAGGCARCTDRHLGKLESGNYSKPCICAHAEENAIVQAAHNGVSTKDAIMYTTFTPCNMCAKMIINAGIREVVAKVAYPDDVGTRLLKDAGVKLRVL